MSKTVNGSHDGRSLGRDLKHKTTRGLLPARPRRSVIRFLVAASSVTSLF